MVIFSGLLDLKFWYFGSFHSCSSCFMKLRIIEKLGKNTYMAINFSCWEFGHDRASLLCPFCLFMHTLTIYFLFSRCLFSLARHLCPPAFFSYTAQIFICPYILYSLLALEFFAFACTFIVDSVLPLNRAGMGAMAVEWLSSMQMWPWSFLKRNCCHKSSYYPMASLLILLQHRCEIQSRLL